MSKTKILVIDDEEAILDALQIFLEQEGYDVQTIDRYDDYLEKVKTLPDMIILDILLMEEDGREIVKKLKASPKTKDIPVIMISAHPRADKTALRFGADAFLAKPFEISLLLETIERLRPSQKLKTKVPTT